MKIAVVGGGINGIMSAWELVKQGHQVILFEQGQVMKQTSSASSKLLHGGLRYLENYEFRLVSEALKERSWWLRHAPHLAHPVKIILPVYSASKRPAWKFKLGLWLYDLFAGKNNIGSHRSINKREIIRLCPGLKEFGLVKGFYYFDVQMDDYNLGLWALEQAKKQPGMKVLENAQVKKISDNGEIEYKFSGRVNKKNYDKVINIAGPWAEYLLLQSNIKSDFSLDLVRGSHIVIDSQITVHEKVLGESQYGFLLENPEDARLFFVLPYKGKTLIGTTEHRQSIGMNIEATDEEINYLIRAYNYYFKDPISKQGIEMAFAGVRPLIKSNKDPNKATREYAIQKNNKLVSVFGGKWTTSRQLAKKVYDSIS